MPFGLNSRSKSENARDVEAWKRAIEEGKKNERRQKELATRFRQSHLQSHSHSPADNYTHSTVTNEFQTSKLLSGSVTGLNLESERSATLRSVRTVGAEVLQNVEQYILGSSNHSLKTSTISVTVNWAVLEFVTKEFTDIDLDLGSILVLDGLEECCQAVVTRDYISARWPNTAPAVLELLERLFRVIVLDLAGRRIHLQEGNDLQLGGIHIEQASWFFVQGGQLEEFFVRLSASPECILDFLEIVGWITAAFRPLPDHFSRFAASGAAFKLYLTGPTMHCIIDQQPMEEYTFQSSQCWHILFDRCIVVTDTAFSLESKGSIGLDQPLEEELRYDNTMVATKGFGLQTSFDTMIGMTGANAVVSWNNSLVLLGFSVVLVPVRRIGPLNESIQWHLIAKNSGGGGGMLGEVEIDKSCAARETFEDIEELQAARFHYLGLWEYAAIMLGTRDACLLQIPRRNHFKDHMKHELASSTVGVTLGFKEFLSIPFSRKFVAPRRQKNQELDTKSLTLAELLTRFRQKVVLMYEPLRGKRAWFVPALSVILHAAIMSAIGNNESVTTDLPFARPAADGNKAAWDALNQESSPIDKLVVIPSPTSGGKAVTFGNILLKIAINVYCMLPTNFTTTDLVGFDFHQLVHEDTQILKKEEGYPTGFSPLKRFLKDRLAAVIFISDEMCKYITPVMSTATACEFERGHNHLLAPIRCLRLLSDNESKFRQDGQLAEGLFWHSQHAPFGNCHHEKCSSGLQPCVEGHIQFFSNKKNEGEWRESIAWYEDAAVVFGENPGTAKAKLKTFMYSKQVKSEVATAIMDPIQ